MTESNLMLSRRDRHGTNATVRSSPAPRAERMPSSSEPAPLKTVVSPPLAVTHAAPAEANARWSVDLQVHADLGEVEQEWKAFESRAERTAFQTFAWLDKWQQHVGTRRGTRPVIVLGRDHDGHLLFLLQLAIEKRGPARCLTWLGSDLCDYNAPLLAEHFSDTVSAKRFVLIWRDILQRLRSERRFRFDFIDLQKLPET